MKKLSTKTVATLTVVTAAAAAVPGLTKTALYSNESHFDKLLQRHDRKGTIRAEILNMTPPEFKKQLRRFTFDEIISKRGMTKRTFRMALLGALRNELRQRGWTATKIDKYVRSRAYRTLPIAVTV